jgi:outer membrane protein assembly factor BamB
VSVAGSPWRPLPLTLLATLLSASLLVSGCSLFHHKKQPKKETAEKPMVLVPLSNHIAVKRVWSSKISGEKPKLRLGLDLAASDDRVFVASHNGTLEALSVATGKREWRVQLKAPLSGGPTVGHGMIGLGSGKGDVILVSESDGHVLWQIHINSEILSGPAIGDDVVVVRTVDGKLHGLAVKDGAENWVVDQQVPKLSLRGTSAPLLSGDLAIGGFDNGRVVAANRRNGTTVWDTAVGQSHGSTELARLIDVDSPVVVEGEDLFAVAYQGRVMHIQRDTGQVLWTHDVSSYRGLAVDPTSVYVSTADGNVLRLDRKNGTEQWTQKALARRQLTEPAVYGGYVIVADGAGVIHWLDPGSGDFVARAEVDKSNTHRPIKSKGLKLKRRVSSQPIVAGGLLLVFSDSGILSAYSAPAFAGK